MKKKCSKCGQEKELDQFYHYPRNKDGLRFDCKKCVDDYARTWAKANPDRVKASWRKRHKKNAEQERLYARRVRKIARQACLDHYGHKCSLCESKSYLCIDHIGGKNGDSKYREGAELWLWLQRKGFPDGFRTLCMRCNGVDGFLRNHPLFHGLGIDGVLERIKIAEMYLYK